MSAPKPLPAYLPRRAGPVRLEGVLLPDRIALEAWIAASEAPGPAGQPRRLIVADLSLGGWRPLQLAAELAAQLGVALPPPESPMPLPKSGALDADAVGHWVDAEARGDSALALADRAVRSLAPTLAEAQATVAVLVPGKPALWRAADLWTLRLLAAVAEPAGIPLVLGHLAATVPMLPAGLAAGWRAAPDPRADLSAAAAGLLDPAPPAEAAWIGAVPGVLAPPLAQVLGIGVEAAQALVALPAAGIALVPPELRAAAAGNEDALATLHGRAGGVPWLAASAAARAGRPLADAELLAPAWSAFGAGAFDLAEELASAALAGAIDPNQKTEAQLALQTLRLVGQDYTAMAAAEAPPAEAPEPDRRRLDRFRGWGKALTGDGEEALDLLGGIPGAESLDEQPWLDLYLRNITALALVRAGRAEAALAVETDIAARLAETERPSWQLVYLNALNLSRLHRGRGDLEAARRCLGRAEEATLGVALPSDLVHFRVLRARLAELAGDSATAGQYWHAAALIFAAMPLPEALGWRVVAAILGRDAGRSVDPERIAEVLLVRLGPPDEGETANAPTLLPAAAGGLEGPAVAVGGPGWGVLAIGRSAPPPFDGPQHAALRRRLGRAPGLAGRNAPTLLVDVRHGLGLPDDLAGLVGSALWHGAEALVWQGERLDLDSLLEGAGQTLVRSPGVAAVEDGQVRFKRYRPPLPMLNAPAALDALTNRPVEALSEAEQASAAKLVSAGVLALETRLSATSPMEVADA